MTAIYAHRGTVTSPDGSTVPGVTVHHSTPAGAGRQPQVPGASAGNGAARENTLEAFRAARRAGADGVELDVRLSADDVPVIHHDRRVPDGRDLANLAWEELSDEVANLEQALRECRGLSVNVEIKHDEGDRRTAEVVAETLSRLAGPAELLPRAAPDALPPVLVSSFDEESLVVVRELQPWVPLGLLIDWQTPAPTGLAAAAALGCATLHPFVTQVDATLVAEAAAAGRDGDGGRGVGLHVWTVNSDADLAAMRDLGVAAVITDRVGAAVQVLRRPPSNGDGVPG